MKFSWELSILFQVHSTYFMLFSLFFCNVKTKPFNLKSTKFDYSSFVTATFFGNKLRIEAFVVCEGIIDKKQDLSINHFWILLIIKNVLCI